MDNKPTSLDIEVAFRIRLRRQEVSMPQAVLAEKLGMSAEQLERCECGKERVGAGRLQSIAKILDVPVMYFFRGATEDVLPSGDVLANFQLSSKNMIALQTAFSEVEDNRMRAKILASIRAFRQGQTEPENEC
jgi:transcriptional regulator with XRE-family HTH domain